ncbi:MAG: hypothetical protein ABSF25_05725 [Bryobacteraceae bacterium]
MPTAEVTPLLEDVNPVLLPVLAAQSHSAHLSPLNTKRLLVVIPDYQTVEPSKVFKPLSAAEKWDLALKETVDPFNLATAVMTAAFSQAGNQTPKYGEGGVAYAQRLAAAVADVGTQNFFSAGVLANLLHQDPRYYRMGPRAGILKRAVYSITRLVVTPRDSGKNTFNSSGLGGMALGIAASNLYYPSASVHGYVMAERLTTSLTGGVVGNLMSEFIPDIQQRVLAKTFLGKMFHWNATDPN